MKEKFKVAVIQEITDKKGCSLSESIEIVHSNTNLFNTCYHDDLSPKETAFLIIEKLNSKK